MKRPCEALAMSPLFKNLDHEQFAPFCNRMNIRVVYKGEVLFNEGEPCKTLGIVLDGRLSIQKYMSNGDFVTIDLLSEGDAFGASLLFGTQKNWTHTVEAVTHTKVVLMTADILLPMMLAMPDLIANYVSFLSDRVQEQNRRISILSQRSLRQKIATYLMDCYEQQKNLSIQPHESECTQQLKEQLKTTDHSPYGSTYMHHASDYHQAMAGYVRSNQMNGVDRMMVQSNLKKRAIEKQMDPEIPTIELPVSKEVVSRLLAMPRPSFSRELVKMEKDGLIKINGRMIQLLDLDRLEMGVFEGMAESVDEGPY